MKNILPRLQLKQEIINEKTKSIAKIIVLNKQFKKKMKIFCIFKKTCKFNKCKYYLLIIFFLLYIEILFSLKQKIYPLKNAEYTNINIFNSNVISYKGEKILKSQLINFYLSTISEQYKSVKKEERQKLNLYLNLPEFSNNPQYQSELRDKFFKEVSKRKNQSITQLDIFFISHQSNFGNSLISINNAIFFCEIIRY